MVKKRLRPGTDVGYVSDEVRRVSECPIYAHGAHGYTPSEHASEPASVNFCADGARLARDEPQSHVRWVQCTIESSRPSIAPARAPEHLCHAPAAHRASLSDLLEPSVVLRRTHEVQQPAAGYGWEARLDEWSLDLVASTGPPLVEAGTVHAEAVRADEVAQ